MCLPPGRFSFLLMVTKFELGRFTKRPDGKYLVSEERTLLGEFPDKPGIYNTPHGPLEMRFEGKPGKSFVVIDVKDIKILYTSGLKRERKIDVTRGNGQVFLPKGRALFVSTDAAPDQFVNK